jgi:hypothetical protein
LELFYLFVRQSLPPDCGAQTFKFFTEITGLEHLDRGYSNLEKKLEGLGATIWRQRLTETNSIDKLLSISTRSPLKSPHFYEFWSCSISSSVSGLMADGVTEITGLEHLDRGYSNLEKKLEGLGATISFAP